MPKLDLYPLLSAGGFWTAKSTGVLPFPKFFAYSRPARMEMIRALPVDLLRLVPRPTQAPLKHSTNESTDVSALIVSEARHLEPS